MLEFFKSVFTGAYDFKSFNLIVGDFFNNIGAARIAGDFTVGAIFTSPGLYSYILMALGLVILFYGKKYFSLLRIAVFGAVGYAIGATFALEAIRPFMGDSVLCNPIIVGAAVAIIAAVLSKTVYEVVLSAVAAMYVFALFGSGSLFDLGLIFNLVVAGLITFAVIYFIARRKNANLIQRISTSVFGAYFIVEGISKNWILIAKPWNIVAIACVATLGYLYQRFKKRKYY